MSDRPDDSNNAEIPKMYPEIADVIPQGAVLFIIQGLERYLDNASLSASEIIGKLDNPCMLYCLEQSVINPLYEKFNFYPLDILSNIFNTSVITMQRMVFADNEDADADPILTSNVEYKSNDVSSEYYRFISIIYGLYKKSKNTGTPEGLDRIIEYLDKYLHLIKSSKQT